MGALPFGGNSPATGDDGITEGRWPSVRGVREESMGVFEGVTRGLGCTPGSPFSCLVPLFPSLGLAHEMQNHPLLLAPLVRHFPP
jgi:hypothetical protein